MEVLRTQKTDPSERVQYKMAPSAILTEVRTKSSETHLQEGADMLRLIVEIVPSRS